MDSPPCQELSKLNGTMDDDSSSRGSWDDDDLTNGDSQVFSIESERDEKKEVYKMSAKDTQRVQLMRFAMTMALLLTALGITLATYKLLKAEEQTNFESAFQKFSRTVGDAAIEQQKNIRDSMKTLAHAVSGHALTHNQTWPFVDISLFELYGQDALRQSNAEWYALMPRVKADDKDAFVNYSTSHYQETIQQGHLMQNGDLHRLIQDKSHYKPYISKKTKDGKYVPDDDRDEYWPSNGQFSPPVRSYGIVNWNCFHVPPIALAIDALLKLQYETVFSVVTPYRSISLVMSPEEHNHLHSKLKDSTPEHPHSIVHHPVHRTPLNDQSDIVAILSSGQGMDAALLGLLPNGVKGIHCIIQNNKNQSFTYEIVGPDAVYQGEGDLHETKYDDKGVLVDLALHTNPAYTTTKSNCVYKMVIYPTATFEDAYHSGTPELFAVVVALTFCMVAIVFYGYDVFVQRRNENLVSKAAQSNAIVSSLFPDHLRDRMMEEKDQQRDSDNRSSSTQFSSKRASLKAFLNDGKTGEVSHQNKPLADLFLETTVMFADIAGFTAWSSVREPCMVFTLLETLYQAFDKVAKRRRIFKVETVGDCYVAVAGLPNPRKDHAVAMARFGRDILTKMHALTKHLEVKLGPDTGDLDLRIGMHSGPVTAGVLRGERARFQLFGDTMNSCARIEASSMRGRILASKETADLMIKQGRESWLVPRDDLVAKGKGIMEAFWVNVDGARQGSVASTVSNIEQPESAHFGYGKHQPGQSDKSMRLIDWNFEMLLQLMKQIVANRNVDGSEGKVSNSLRASQHFNVFDLGNTVPLEEVKEIIALPEFKAGSTQMDPTAVKIPTQVKEELHLLVSEIASLYNENPFHSFEHASHVVMSVIKLMSRIVAPDLGDVENDEALHDHTYGITSDPLTHFAAAFSALIHDADHVGVSNAQLVKEGVPIAAKYKERSVAEQNSLDLSWDLLMSTQFNTLRHFLFPTQPELIRFRQLVVNSVMSTDIVDKDLKALRNARWDKAFKKGNGDEDSWQRLEECPKDARNRKATIVIEHIIQASDISHTMQHWHVYRKWNQNLFEELYVAYLNGRMDKDPSDFWYKGEFGFFDFYIIPLTQKLKECGVFGVSSDEYLNYALKNRQEWETKGEDVVAGMIKECHRKYGTKNADGTVQEPAHASRPAPAMPRQRTSSKSTPPQRTMISIPEDNASGFQAVADC